MPVTRPVVHQGAPFGYANALAAPTLALAATILALAAVTQCPRVLLPAVRSPRALAATITAAVLDAATSPSKSASCGPTSHAAQAPESAAAITRTTRTPVPALAACAMRRHTDRVHHHLHHICVLRVAARPCVRQRAHELRAVCCIQPLPATFAAFSVSARTVGLQHDVSGVHGLRAFVRFRRGPASWVRRLRGVFALRPAVAAVAAAGSAIEALQHAA